MDVRIKMRQIQQSLIRTRSYLERHLGLFEIKEVDSAVALGMYKTTITRRPPTFLIEPISAWWIETHKEPVTIEWTTDPQKIGAKVTSRVSGIVRERFADYVNRWVSYGAPYGSTGAVFCSTPNKSFEKISILQEHPEYLSPVVNLRFEEEWLSYWSMAIQLRYDATLTMLSNHQQDRETFSRHNKAAGTGVSIRGLRRTREQLENLGSEDLQFLAAHQAGSAMMFAVTQTVRPTPGKVWMIKYLDPRIMGALAHRSDADIDEISFDKSSRRLTMTVSATTRQVGADGSGVLSNSDTESRLFGRSVSEEIWRRWLLLSNAEEQHPPFLGMRYLFEAWSTPTQGGHMTLVGQDFGMLEPIKAGADNLFASTFITMGNKTLPHLLSGTWFTSLSYVPFQVYWGRYLRRLGGSMIPLGDDLTFIVPTKNLQKALDIFSPYLKVKSTKGDESKILGFWTHREGEHYLIGQTPRILKTESSASQFSSEWKNALPQEVPLKGNMEMRIPLSIELAVRESLPIASKLTYFEGERTNMPSLMTAAWMDPRSIAEYLPDWVKYYSICEEPLGEGD